MTVQNSDGRDQYVATAGQTVFPYTFEIVSKDDITVVQNDTILAEGTNYSLTGVGSDTGGNMTLAVGATAGDIITTYRSMALERTTDYQNSGDFLAAEVNDDFDRLWLALQQGQEVGSRAIVKPVVDAASINMTLPEAALRFNSFLGFDATGAVTVVPAGDPGSPDSIIRQQFTGNGSTTVFTLSFDMKTFGAALQVYIDGVHQTQGTYTVSGTALTFTEAPPVDAGIEVVFVRVTSIGETDASLVSYTPAGSGAVATTVQDKLDERINVEDFGAQGLSTSVDTAATQAAITRAVATGALFIYCELPALKLSAMDFQGVGIKGSGTDLAAVAGISNIGRLENCIVRGLSTDTGLNHSVPQQIGLSPKAIYKDSADKLSIIMKRKTGGFIKAEHVYNSFTSGSSDAGGASETWRLANTRHLSACYVYKQTSSSETAGAWGAPQNMLFGQAFPAGTVQGKAVTFRAASAVDAEISWEIEASSVGEVRQLAIYSTGGSSSTVELYVNGVLQRSFSAVLVGTNYILPVKFECTVMGTNTIKLKKVGGVFLNVIGVDYYNLDETPSAAIADTLSYGDYNKKYTTGTGAQEYAFFSVAQQKWMGQVHGGETASVAAILTVDGVVTPIPVTDEHFIVCDALSLYQQSRMQVGSDYMDVKTTYNYAADSSVYFTCSMEGNATVDKAYTTMSTTNETFDEVSFPFVQRLVPNKNLLLRTNAVTQFNRFTGQRLTTSLTLYPMGGNTGANMTANGPYVALVAGSYAKLYYGPVTDSPTTLTKLGHSIERIFE
jgi:hypothetical protein